MQSTFPRRWWALAALAVALVTFGLDMTVMNVAMPTLASDLDASTSQLQWFANAYTLVVAAALLPAGLLGDKLGPRAWLLTGLALFGIASVGCAYARSAEQLIAARALLGIGAALMVPLSASMLTRMFPPGERARAIAIWSTAMSLGIPLGPVVGGWLLDHFWWGSVFLINVPLVVLGLVALTIWLPAVPGVASIRIDWSGVALSSAGLVSLTYGLVKAGDRGWTNPLALTWVAAGLLALVVFAAWQRRAVHPLVDIRLFHSRGFLWGSLIATISTFSMLGALFVLPQFFSAVQGANALSTGLRLLPLIAGLLVGVQLVSRLRPALGAKVVVAAGFVVMAAGLLLGTRTSTVSEFGFVTAWLGIVGVGFGATMPPSIDLALGALARERSGVGSALMQAMRQVGGTFGVAVLGAVLNAAYRSSVDVAGLPGTAAGAVKGSAEGGIRVAESLDSSTLLRSVRQAFVDGMSSMLWACVGVAAIGAILATIFLPRYADDQEEQSKDTIDA